MDYPMLKVISEMIDSLPQGLKEINGIGTTIVLTKKSHKDYGDMSRYAILISASGGQVMMSALRIHTTPYYTNISGNLVSGVSYNSSDRTITITLSAQFRVSGLLFNDDVTDTVTFSNA